MQQWLERRRSSLYGALREYSHEAWLFFTLALAGASSVFGASQYVQNSSNSQVLQVWSNIVTLVALFLAICEAVALLRHTRILLERRAREVLPPWRAVDSAMTPEDLASAIKRLALYHWRRHEFGRFPVIHDFKAAITASALTSTEASLRGFPTNVDDIHLAWMKFHLDESWFLYPIVDESGALNPTDYLSHLIVCTETAMRTMTLNRVESPRVSIYYPIPEAMATRATLLDALTTQNCHYLDLATVSCSAARRPGQSPPVALPVKRLERDSGAWLHALSRAGAWNQLNDIDKAAINAGILEVYELGYENQEADKGKLQFDSSKLDHEGWEMALHLDYFLPAKAFMADDELWDQTRFDFPFPSTVRGFEVVFRATGPIVATEPHVSLSAIGPSEVPRPTLDDPSRTWTVELKAETEAYAYAGDQVSCPWRDTIIAKRRAEGLGLAPVPVELPSSAHAGS